MKNLKLTTFLILVSTAVYSQGFFFTAKGGYAIGVNTESNVLVDHEYKITQSLPTGNTETHKLTDVPLSYGSGMIFGGSVGYMFNQFIGIDLGFSYLKGSKTIIIIPI
jgi:hypothetical protein